MKKFKVSQIPFITGVTAAVIELIITSFVLNSLWLFVLTVVQIAAVVSFYKFLERHDM